MESGWKGQLVYIGSMCAVLGVALFVIPSGQDTVWILAVMVGASYSIVTVVLEVMLYLRERRKS